MSPAINNANSVARNTAATAPIETALGLLSVALVFFLTVADNVLLFTLSCRISFSRISSEVRLANSGSVEKFLTIVFKSLHKHPQFDDKLALVELVWLDKLEDDDVVFDPNGVVEDMEGGGDEDGD